MRGCFGSVLGEPYFGKAQTLRRVGARGVDLQLILILGHISLQINTRHLSAFVSMSSVGVPNGKVGVGYRGVPSGVSSVKIRTLMSS